MPVRSAVTCPLGTTARLRQCGQRRSRVSSGDGLESGKGGPVCRRGRTRPDARERDVRCVNQRTRWEALSRYHVRRPSVPRQRGAQFIALRTNTKTAPRGSRAARVRGVRRVTEPGSSSARAPPRALAPCQNPASWPRAWEGAQKIARRRSNLLLADARGQGFLPAPAAPGHDLVRVPERDYRLPPLRWTDESQVAGAVGGPKSNYAGRRACQTMFRAGILGRSEHASVCRA